MTTMVVTADKGSEVSKIYKSVIGVHFVRGKYVQDCGLSLLLSGFEKDASNKKCGVASQAYIHVHQALT